MLAAGERSSEPAAPEQPLVTFRIVRSFAHQSERKPRLHPGSHAAAGASGPVTTAAADDANAGGGGGRGGAESTTPGQRSPAQSTPRTAGGGGNGGGGRRTGTILSFKELELELAPVDFTAHESFLSAAFSFAVQLPLQDVWQVRCCSYKEAGSTVIMLLQSVLCEDAWFGVHEWQG